MLRNLFRALVGVLAFIGAVVVAVVAWIAISMATYRGGCTWRFSGFERQVWYEGGKENKAWQGYGWGYFPALDDHVKFKEVGVVYDHYDRFVECGEAWKDARNFNVVRFSVAPGFKFVPSARYTDAGEVPDQWRHEPPADYVPVRGLQRQALYKRHWRREESWLSPPDTYVQGRKVFIDSLAIDWLKDEPLDEAHLMGIWQGGWLFRSAKAGHYVWID